MSTHKNEKLTGAFRFSSQWHVHDSGMFGKEMPGKSFAEFGQCPVCGGNVRYCGIVSPSAGLPNHSVSPNTQELEWVEKRQRFADISTRCACDREGDLVCAAEYDRRPFSISYDGRTPTPTVKSNFGKFLNFQLGQLIKKLERLQKRIG
jgi:hypothetical protein